MDGFRDVKAVSAFQAILVVDGTPPTGCRMDLVVGSLQSMSPRDSFPIASTTARKPALEDLSRLPTSRGSEREDLDSAIVWDAVAVSGWSG